MHYLLHFLSFLFFPFILNFSNNPDSGEKEGISCPPLALSWPSPFGTSFGGGLSVAALAKAVGLSVGSLSSWVFGSLWDLQPSLILL